MRHASLVVVAVALATATRRVDRLVDRLDDLRDRDRLGGTTQPIAAARAAHAIHQFAATQATEQLLQIRERDALAFADASQRDRTGVLAQAKVDHGGDSKTAFGGETHVTSAAAASRADDP